MKSTARFKSHPLHPMLVNFPIAFFTGTVIADIAFLFTEDPFHSRIAVYLEGAGIITGLLAAVPGLIDFIYSVPGGSSGKKRGAKHGILNTTMILIFTITFFTRIYSGINHYLVTGLELAGFGIMSAAGWMGGTLVYRNQIGVDHRYAGAGKWKEDTVDSDSDLVELKGISEMRTNQMRLFHINGKRVVIGKTENGFAAFDDFCTHRGGSLADGALICGTVQCPWHGSQFSVTDGEVKAGPAGEKIRVYPVEFSEGKYFLRIR